MAQDLLLFVLFFDLMLIPFFFLFAGWGDEHEGREWESTIKPGPATIKMVVYTLVGSLLMLAGAIATGVIAGGDGTPVFSMSELAADPLGEGSQRWIFCFFALAFLVKMPAFLVHGWMADAYRVAPLPALALFSAVLSKVGAYGFLKVVLPIYPAATRPVPGGAAGRRGRLDPLRLDHGLHPDERPAGRRLLVDRAARLHHARRLRPAPRRRRRRDPPDGQPRPRDRPADAPLRRPRRADRRHRRHHPDGRPRPPRPGDGGPLPGPDDGAPRHARLGQLRRRVLHPQRHLRVEARLRARSPPSASRWPPTTPCASTSTRCTTASARASSRARSAGARERSSARWSRASSRWRSTRR